MYALRRCMSDIIDFKKNTIGGCKFIQLAIFAYIVMCTPLTDPPPPPIMLTIDIYVRYTMMHV